MLTVPQLARTLQTVFTTTAETVARDAQFIKRQRKLTGPAFVQGLVFGWLAHPDATYDQLAQAVARAGAVMSPQALEQRFTEAAVQVLAAVLDAASRAVLQADTVGSSLLTRFTAVWLLDSSTVRLPDHYAGLAGKRGGGDGGGQAACARRPPAGTHAGATGRARPAA
jgi:cytochrome P450